MRGERTSRWKPPLIPLILGAILIISGALLFFPSPHFERLEYFQNRLKNVYKGPMPSEIAIIQSGCFVTARSHHPIDIKTIGDGLVYVANVPSNAGSGAALGFVEVPNQDERSMTRAVLLAPGPISNNWTIYARLALATAVSGKEFPQLPKYAREINWGSGDHTLAMKSLWMELPADTKAKVESIVEANRKIAKQLGKDRSMLRTADGTWYEAKGSESIDGLLVAWEIAANH